MLLESRLLSLVADKLQNKDPQMLKRMRLAIDEGVPQKLHDLKLLNEHERSLKMNTIATVLDDLGMKTETAYEIVNYFGEALGYKPIAAPLSPPLTAASTTGGIQRTPKIGSIIPFGGYDWRVLDVQNNKALILSEKIIEERAYKRKDITWETCKLRRYLNGAFYNKFSSQDRARIAETRITTNNPWYKEGNATNDKIFLLSIQELALYYAHGHVALANISDIRPALWLNL